MCEIQPAADPYDYVGEPLLHIVKTRRCLRA